METPPPSARSFQPGTRLGRYRVVRRLGMGGMAELYLALADGASGFEKVVVLKLVHAHLAADPKLSAMLLREAKIAALLDHPHIAHVHDAGTDGGEHYLVMEYIHGRDIGAVLRTLPRGEPLPMAAALEVVRCACQALHYAHTKTGLDGRPLGLVHRDVSPSNVLVSYGGNVSLVDFGIAKIGAQVATTQTGVLKGKFGYMSPEQSLGAALDHRSDVFALGILLYELTTGRRAFSGANAFAILNKIAVADYVPPERVRPDYPARLAQIIARAMQPRAEDRYPTAAAMQADLDAFVIDTNTPVGAQPLGALMHRLFGEPPFPVVADLPDRSPATLASLSSESMVTPMPRPGRTGWIAGALAVTLAGIGGWWAGSTHDDLPAPPQQVRVGAPDAPVVDAAPRPRPPDAEPVPRPPPPEVDAAPVVESTPLPASESDNLGTKRRRGRTPARPTPFPRPAAASVDPLDNMLPPSMQ